MLTVEIKINGHHRETISCVQVEPKIEFDRRELSYDMEKQGWRVYEINGTFRIQHKRQDGHRELARKALDAVKGFKK